MGGKFPPPRRTTTCNQMFSLSAQRRQLHLRWGPLAPPIASPQSPGGNGDGGGYLPWRTGFTGWVTPQRFRLNGRTLNIQLFTHAIVSHPLLPDFLTPVCVPCPDTSAHDKHKALLPVITLRTCTSVSQQRLCARRLDENILPRSQPLWCRMKSSHLQVKWTKIRPSIRKVG